MAEAVIKKRQFTPEFKLEASEQVLDRGHSFSYVASVMGVSKSSVYEWVNQLKNERSGHYASNANAMTADAQKIKLLEKEVKRLNTEIEILKKALTLFT